MRLWKKFMVLFLLITFLSVTSVVSRTPGQIKTRDLRDLFSLPEASTHPIRRFRDENDIRHDVIAVCAPFRGDNTRDFIFRLKAQNVKIIGVQHYQEFPNSMSNPSEDPYVTTHPIDYISLCDAWLTCERNPEKTFRKRPYIELVESDFADARWLENVVVKTNGAIPKKEFDFIYSVPGDPGQHKSPNTTCNNGGWQSHCRNWELAKQCLPILCTKMGLFGVVVGRECLPNFDELGVSSHVKLVEFQKYHDLQVLFKKARFLFVPNKSDASPRVLTECLAHGTPVIVNEDIVGGWKYVNNKTGAFFTDPQNVEAAAKKALKISENSRGVQDTFQVAYGKEKSAKALSAFFNDTFGFESKTITFV
tara:strand:- start:2438 stop:3529 length:1092 start_codon:yes stop_codon:yes gene_type:complete